MIIPVKMKNESYNIYLERGALNKVKSLFNITSKKVLIVTDSGVPMEYAQKVKAQMEKAYVYTFKEGEASKNLNTFKEICEALLNNGFTREDAVIAVGGGVTGDMAGFAAACYMRGIDFYNIPTTLLSQVDSSIGGKTAIDLNSIKNIIGAFYQPKAVIIDPDVLKTLPKRQLSNGIAESIKMGATFDERLFALCESEDYLDNIDEIIERSLLVKKSVVEEDEKEKGLRKVLNFGHTVGHAIESYASFETLYHGECVALGMLAVSKGEVKERIKKALKNCGLPIEFEYDEQEVFKALLHDKKANSKGVTLVKCEKIGTFIFEETSMEELKKYL